MNDLSGRNPKPLIQIEPKMLIDEKNRQAIVDRGDVLPANGTRIPLPGGFLLPTTGLWSRILDNPEVRPCCIPVWIPVTHEARLTLSAVDDCALQMSRLG